MSLANTDTRLVRLLPAHGRARVPLDEGAGRHRLSRRITPEQIANARRFISAPVAVEAPAQPETDDGDTTRLVSASSKPSVLARLRANLGRWSR